MSIEFSSMHSNSSVFSDRLLNENRKQKHDDAVEQGKSEFLDGVKKEGMIKPGVLVFGKDKNGKPEHKWTGSSPLGALIALIFRGGGAPYLKPEGKNVDTKSEGVPKKIADDAAKKGETK